MKYSPILALVLSSIIGACGESQGPDDSNPALRNRIVFVSNRDGANQLYSMEPDGTDIRMIPSGVSGVVQFPAVSPDGKRIALVVFGDIHVVNSDGSDLTNLTNSPGSDTRPDWSPDGSSIAFESNREGNDDIFVMGSFGSGLKQITTDPANDHTPSWSPDGSRIAFSTHRTGDGEIFTMDPDGGGLLNITQDSSFDGSPSWGPDGRIAFISNRHARTSNVFIMNGDGSDITPPITPDSMNGHPAGWSPDSRQLVFPCFITHDICIINDNGTGLISITTGPEIDEYPTWSP